MILLIEDNTTIAENLKYFFEMNHYQLNYVTSYSDALNYLKKHDINLLILDITLPDGNGILLYQREIKEKKIPTIFLTANDDEEKVCLALDLGAEDYITKPFSTKELLSRVKRCLLRYEKKSVITINHISFDMDKMAVYKGKKTVDLTALELKILQLLFLSPNKVVNRNTILDKIWEITGNDVDDHTLTVYMKRIREKIGYDVIKTVKKVGYRIDEE